MVTTLLDEIEAFLRAARLPSPRPAVKCFGFDDQPARYTCPNCGVYWQPALNRGCRRVRGRIHQCWPTVPRS
jgi:hypothetical protein